MISITQASEKTGVSASTLRRAVRLGKLPAKQFGRTYVVRLADVLAWHEKEYKSQYRRK